MSIDEPSACPSISYAIASPLNRDWSSHVTDIHHYLPHFGCELRGIGHHHSDARELIRRTLRCHALWFWPEGVVHVAGPFGAILFCALQPRACYLKSAVTACQCHAL